MKKLSAIAAFTVAFTTIGIAFAAISVEVDQAQVTFTADPKVAGTTTTCLGEDGVGYQTVTGASWKGTATDTNPAAHDIPLTGSLTLTATFTVNATTGTGYVTGKATLKDSATKKKIFAAPFTAVSQITDVATQAAELRGFFDAPLFDATGTATGDRILANFEAKTDATGKLTGQFGLAAGSHASLDYSIETTKLTCP